MEIRSDNVQHSDEWFLARKGKITASEVYLLLQNHKESMTEEELAEHKKENPKSRVTTKEVPFSQGTFTWLNHKVAELYMPDSAFLEYMEERSKGTRATQWGTDWESTARARYQLTTGREVFEVGFIRLEGMANFAGGSPDGVLRAADGIIEIKCPYTPETHYDFYIMTTPQELAEYSPQYYAQMQFNMMVTKSEFCDFISFDPRTTLKKRLKILRIPKDEQMQQALRERVKLAAQYYRERMDKIEAIGVGQNQKTA